jgi:hypothetical protein
MNSVCPTRPCRANPRASIHGCGGEKCDALLARAEEGLDEAEWLAGRHDGAAVHVDHVLRGLVQVVDDLDDPGETSL